MPASVRHERAAGNAGVPRTGAFPAPTEKTRRLENRRSAGQSGLNPTLPSPCSHPYKVRIRTERPCASSFSIAANAATTGSAFFTLALS